MFVEKHLAVLSLAETLEFLGPKLIASLFCGGLIGLERELKSKAAGIKTNMLICVGATLYTAISILMASSQDSLGVHGDPGRIAAQIVSGIGFLGGGAILHSKENVTGLTTAATIWLVAALGVWIGMGQIEVALAVTVLIVTVLISVTFFENRYMGRKRTFKLVLHVKEHSEEVAHRALEGLITSCELALQDYKENMAAPSPEIRLSYHGRLNDHSRLLLELWKIPGILDVKQIQ